MTQPHITIHWFRQDLRLSDNPALSAAIERGEVIPVYILDTHHSKEHAMGGASRWWLHHSLLSLSKTLDNALLVQAGDPLIILPALAKKYGASHIHWNRCYEPWRIARDAKLKEILKAENITAESFNGSLLWEPWEVKKPDGTPYKVFTPYYRRGCLSAPPPREPLPAPSAFSAISSAIPKEAPHAIEALRLLPTIRWDTSLEPHWKIGEAAAQDTLYDFLDNGLSHYKEGRNFPAKPYVSRLSPYLHFGEISPHQVWYAARNREESANLDHFCTELGWREFSHSLLYYNPTLPRKNLQERFDHFPWRNDEEKLQCWQRGQTGYPIVDAGMRELWQTGYMHNRVRMIVGSFLVKNLLLHWHHGERWFWDCLVDADLANNSASWQWIAGCGADAAPYFRVFNPVTQGERFDEAGDYTRRYVPELKNLPNKYLYKPWEAPSTLLKEAGITLGTTYPHPIVDVKTSRERALEAFTATKQAI